MNRFQLLLIALFYSLFISGQEDKKDFYTDIAGHEQAQASHRTLEAIPEFVLPRNKTLPISRGGKYYFNPSHKIENKAQVNKALLDLKKQYSPFLKNFAPKFTSARQEIRITKMQFKYEDKSDTNNFNDLVEGKGDWKDITIPYYHGPQGISTAWYRVELDIPKEMIDSPSLVMHFNGSDYYTNAFINGFHVGYHEGMLDEFEFNIKKYAKVGKNIILIKLENDYSLLGNEGYPRHWGNKLSASNCPGWDDPFSGWSCCPTGYGLYQDLYIVAKSKPYIADIFCRPIIKDKQVEVWSEIDLTEGNLANNFVLEYNLYGQNFKSTILKGKKDTIRVEGGRVLYKTLISIPETKYKEWNPKSPWLYQLQVSLYSMKDQTKLMDNYKVQFGMREFKIDKNSKPKGRMYLNNKEVRLRGANTMGFLQKSVMKHDWDRLIDDLLLAKLTNMNFIRTTQRIMPKEVYEYADKLGMMMQADLPLFAYINQKQYTEILKQAGNIERLLRNHPSNIMLTYVNEPMAEVKAHAISRKAYENLFDALDIVVHNENPDRAIKYVDGDYQAPSNGYPDNHCYNIWYDGHAIALDSLDRGAWLPVSKGWMYGCGEFGAEGLDPVSLMKKHYPKEWLKKEKDGSWSPKYMHGKYQGEQTYGKHWRWFETEHTMKGWVKASQEHQEWGVSKVTKAYRRMPRMNSFAVHLFIDAWPNGWMKAIIDSERTPKKAWYAYRDALSPLAIQLFTERTNFFEKENGKVQVWICNDTHKVPSATMKYYISKNNKIIYSGTQKAVIPTIKEGSKYQGILDFKMPKVKQGEKVTVHIALINDQTNQIIHDDKIELKVYPKIQLKRKPNTYLIGESKESIYLSKKIGKTRLKSLDQVEAEDIIIISDSTLTKTEFEKINEVVKNGAKAIVMHSAINSETIKEELQYKTGRKDESWILFRNKQHKATQGTTRKGLFYPYSSLTKRPHKYHITTYKSKVITPILTHSTRIAYGEKKEAKGKWIVCGVTLNGMLNTNPEFMKIIYQNLLER